MSSQNIRPYRVIGPRLRTLRVEAGVGLRALAVDAGISPGLLSMIENGTRQPSMTTMVLLAESLGLSYSELLHFVAVKEST